MAAKKETIVLSLGGSLIVPDEIDVGFLKRFRELILKHARSGKRFILITGGGMVCRRYQNAAAELTDLNKEELDWLGIKVTIMNAEFVRTVFKEHAYPEVIRNPTKVVKTDKSVLVGAGWKPGCSTDMDAVLIAKAYKASKVVNLSNIDQVCDKDPKYHKDAKPVSEISWKAFRKLVGSKWDPGANLPFDPIAAREAEKLGLEVVIMNGKRIANLDSYLSGKGFKGTVIK